MRSRRSVFPARKEGGSLSLPFVEPDPVTAIPVQAAARPATSEVPATPDPAIVPQAQLWLGLWFAQLILEVHIETGKRERPAVVIEERQGQFFVKALSVAAHRHGVTQQMNLSAALALSPELDLYEFDALALQGGLECLAQLAGSFTATVCPEPPDRLLLEIAGSLRLFGGQEAFLRHIESALQAADRACRFALAPTPQAASWLARWAPGARVDDRAGLESALRSLPVQGLGWSREALSKLESIGVRTLGECRRLPRSGFARRFGPELLLQLDRAYGNCPDPRTPYREPETFREEVELSQEVSDTDVLFEACAVLLQRFSAFLRRRQAVARELAFRFFPFRGVATELLLRSGVAGQQTEHWLELLRVKLERLELYAPVIVVELGSAGFSSADGRTAELAFSPRPGKTGAGTAIHSLVERLSARLGDDAVRYVSNAAESRPELAARYASPRYPGQVPHCAACSPWAELRGLPQGLFAPGGMQRLLLQRPLWILDSPRELAVRDRQPCYQGRLQLCSGPERIETGWWDGRDTARDYYVAASDAGAHLWVFRERRYRKGRWYLHGYFG